MKYDEKHMKIYEKLGALQFQKAVFWLENVKYFVIDNFFPNAANIYNKYLDKKMKRELNKYNDASKKKMIVNYYRYEKLKFKKENIKKENRNYHIDLNHPAEFVRHLNNNKKIHVVGLKINVILVLAMVIFINFMTNPALFWYLFLGYEVLSAIINFQCINLQNYNLCRFENERMKQLLEKMEEKRNKEYSRKIGEGSKAVAKAFECTEEIPSLDEVIAQITTNEQAIQLLEYAKEQLSNMKNNNHYIETRNKERRKIM